jgi:hypothetical protein
MNPIIRTQDLLDAGLPPFIPEPNSLWLVIVECRFNVVHVSPCGKGFFIPGQEPCWGLDHVDTWVREITPTHAEMNACDISDIPSQTH